jgi:hypothetical protein
VPDADPEPGEQPDPAAPQSFADVSQEHPFYDDIEWMADEGISRGYPDGTFRPSVGLSRMAMAAFMHRLAGSPPVEGSCDVFTDVSREHPFCVEIAWMAEAGVATGYDDGTFRSSAEVTRMAMAAFMHRLAVDNGAQ